MKDKIFKNSGCTISSVVTFSRHGWAGVGQVLSDVVDM